MWHVSSRSGVATLRTAIHWLLLLLLTARSATMRNAVLSRIVSSPDDEGGTVFPRLSTSPIDEDRKRYVPTKMIS